jgi:hypothetical protein
MNWGAVGINCHVIFAACFGRGCPKQAAKIVVRLSKVTEGVIEQVPEWKYRSYGYQKMKVPSFG